MSRFDCIIVGQGLAGTCLAFQFIKRNKSVFVIDEKAGADSTAVAAGTFNPIVFKTFATTWMAPVLLPYMQEFYGRLGEYIHSDLVSDRRVIKGMKSEAQMDLWKMRSTLKPSSEYLEVPLKDKVHGLKNERAYGYVNGCGNLDVPSFLQGFRHKLLSMNLLREDRLDYRKLEVNDRAVKYMNLEADRIIFCQGHENSLNPFFSHLPLIGTKGELLIIHAPDLDSSDIIHNRVNIVPLGEDKYWVGATFDWDHTDLKKTKKGKEELVERIKETLDVDFEILEHRVGIRPATRDRRPFLGFADEHKRVGLFNGMGARGVMLAPYFSEQLYNHIYTNVELHPEADIRRFSEAR